MNFDKNCLGYFKFSSPFPRSPRMLRVEMELWRRSRGWTAASVSPWCWWWQTWWWWLTRTDPSDSDLEYLSRCLVLMTLRVGDQVSHVIPRGGKIKVVPCHRVTLPPLDFTGPADMRVRESNEYNYFHTLFIESCWQYWQFIQCTRHQRMDNFQLGVKCLHSCSWFLIYDNKDIVY